MSMDLTVLEAALQATEPSATEAEAITALVDAYSTYAADAQAEAAPDPGIPLLPAGLEAGKVAMATALQGMNEDGAGLVLIPAGVVAFWVAVALGLSASFAGATVVIPPPHVTFASEFLVEATANVTENRNKEDSLEAIAGIMHSNAITGGSMTIVTPVFNII